MLLSIAFHTQKLPVRFGVAAVFETRMIGEIQGSA